MTETGPIPRTPRAPTAPPVRSPRRTDWARDDQPRCTSGDPHRRCMLADGHGGLHAWRSLGELRTFEWG